MWYRLLGLGVAFAGALYQPAGAVRSTKCPDNCPVANGGLPQCVSASGDECFSFETKVRCPKDYAQCVWKSECINGQGPCLEPLTGKCADFVSHSICPPNYIAKSGCDQCAGFTSGRCKNEQTQTCVDFETNPCPEGSTPCGTGAAVNGCFGSTENSCGLSGFVCQDGTGRCFEKENGQCPQDTRLCDKLGYRCNSVTKQCELAPLGISTSGSAEDCENTCFKYQCIQGLCVANSDKASTDGRTLSQCRADCGCNDCKSGTFGPYQTSTDKTCATDAVDTLANLAACNINGGVRTSKSTLKAATQLFSFSDLEPCRTCGQQSTDTQVCKTCPRCQQVDGNSSEFACHSVNDLSASTTAICPSSYRLCQVVQDAYVWETRDMVVGGKSTVDISLFSGHLFSSSTSSSKCLFASLPPGWMAVAPITCSITGAANCNPSCEPEQSYIKVRLDPSCVPSSRSMLKLSMGPLNLPAILTSESLTRLAVGDCAGTSDNAVLLSKAVVPAMTSLKTVIRSGSVLDNPVISGTSRLVISLTLAAQIPALAYVNIDLCDDLCKDKSRDSFNLGWVLNSAPEKTVIDMTIEGASGYPKRCDATWLKALSPRSGLSITIPDAVPPNAALILSIQNVQNPAEVSSIDFRNFYVSVSDQNGADIVHAFPVVAQPIVPQTVFLDNVFNVVSVILYCLAVAMALPITRVNGITFSVRTIWTDLTSSCVLIHFATLIAINSAWIQTPGSYYYYLEVTDFCIQWTMLLSVCFHWTSILTHRLRKVPTPVQAWVFALLNLTFYGLAIWAMVKTSRPNNCLYTNSRVPTAAQISDLQPSDWKRKAGQCNTNFFLLHYRLGVSVAFAATTLVLTGLGAMVMIRGNMILRRTRKQGNNGINERKNDIIRKAIAIYCVVIAIVTVTYGVAWILQIYGYVKSNTLSLNNTAWYIFVVWLPNLVPPCAFIFLQSDSGVRDLSHQPRRNRSSRYSADGTHTSQIVNDLSKDTVSLQDDEVTQPSSKTSSLYSGDTSLSLSVRLRVLKRTDVSGWSGRCVVAVYSQDSISSESRGRASIGAILSEVQGTAYQVGFDPQASWKMISSTEVAVVRPAEALDTANETEEVRFVAVLQIPLSTRESQPLRFVIYEPPLDLSSVGGATPETHSEYSSPDLTEIKPRSDTLESSPEVSIASSIPPPPSLNRPRSSSVPSSWELNAGNSPPRRFLFEFQSNTNDLRAATASDEILVLECATSKPPTRKESVQAMTSKSSWAKAGAIFSRSSFSGAATGTATPTNLTPAQASNLSLSGSLATAELHLQVMKVSRRTAEEATQQANYLKHFVFPGTGVSPLVAEKLIEGTLACEVPRQLLALLITKRTKVVAAVSEDLRAYLEATEAAAAIDTRRISVGKDNILGKLQDGSQAVTVREWLDQRVIRRKQYIEMLKYCYSVCQDRQQQKNFIKPSSEKKSGGLRFLPTNLHTRRIVVSREIDTVAECSPSLPVRVEGQIVFGYDTTAIGAFAAHTFKFKNGGLTSLKSRLQKMRNRSGTGDSFGSLMGRTTEKELSEGLPTPQWSVKDLEAAASIAGDGGRTTENFSLNKRFGSNQRLTNLRGLGLKGWSEEDMRVDDLEWEIMCRMDICFTQAMTALVTAFASSVNEVFSSADVDRALHRQELWMRLGFLVQVESLLSTADKELGMLEDVASAVSQLRHARFVLEDVSNISSSAQANSLEESRIGSVIIEADKNDENLYLIRMQVRCAGVPLLSELKMGHHITVLPVLFTSGQKKLAQKSRTRSKAWFQDAINHTNLRVIDELWSHYKALGQRMPHLAPPPSAEKFIEDALHKLNELDRVSQGSKKRDCIPIVLADVADLCRLLGAARITLCKSGKDRTRMSVTYEQGRILSKYHALPQKDVGHMVSVMRTHGVLPDFLRSSGKRRVFESPSFILSASGIPATLPGEIDDALVSPAGTEISVGNVSGTQYQYL